MVIYDIIEILSNCIENFILLYFINKFFDVRKGKKQNLLFLSFLFGSTSVSTAVQFFENSYLTTRYSALLDMLGILIIEIYAIISSKKSLFFKISFPIIEYCVALIIAMGTNILVSTITRNDSVNLLFVQNSTRIGSLIATKVLLFLSLRIVLLILDSKSDIFCKYEQIAISILLIVSLFFSAFLIEFRMKFSEEHYINLISSICFLVILSMDVISIFLIKIIANKNKTMFDLSIYKLKYQRNKELYDSIEGIYQNLKLLNHDISNKLMPLYTYIENKENEKALIYLKKISNENFNNFIYYINTNSEPINTIFNIKLNMARNHNIDVECNIFCKLLKIDEGDIISLFSNMFDNAYEAELKEEKRKIIIDIYKERAYICIKISNTISKSVLTKNPELTTNKANKQYHGYGIQSIIKIVNKHDGLFDFYEEGNMFIASAFLKDNN